MACLTCASLCAQYPVMQSAAPLVHERTLNSRLLSSECTVGTACKSFVERISRALIIGFCNSDIHLLNYGVSSRRCGWQGRVSDAHSRGEAACAQLQGKLDQSGAALQSAATNQKELEKQKRAVDKKLVRALR